MVPGTTFALVRFGVSWSINLRLTGQTVGVAGAECPGLPADDKDRGVEDSAPATPIHPPIDG